MIVDRNTLSEKDKKKVAQYENAIKETISEWLGYFLLFLGILVVISKVSGPMVDIYIVVSSVISAILFCGLFFGVYKCGKNTLKRTQYLIVVGTIYKGGHFNKAMAEKEFGYSITIDNETFYITKRTYLKPDFTYSLTVTEFEKEMRKFQDGQKRIFLVEPKTKYIKFDMTKILKI